MSYYKPTSFSQKIVKLIQLFLYFLIIKLRPKPKPKIPKHSSVLMIVSKLDRIGGLERQALELAAALVRRGCLITVLTDRIDDDSPRVEIRSGFLIRRLTRSTNPFAPFTLAFYLIRYRHTYRLIHAHGVTGFTVVSLLLGKLIGRRTILKGATQDDFAKIFQKDNFKNRLYRKWIPGVDVLIAISQALQEEMIACGILENRIKRIPNAVNADKFFPPSKDRKISLRTRFSVSPEQNLFLFLGRLETRKAVDILLRAWHKCAPGVLWIVGAGPEEERLKRVCAELHLKNVVFHGESRTPADYYHAADVFVFPSVKEGSPGVVLEAMSSGLPCIAGRIGGIVDVMENRKQGLIVSPGSVDELADAIQYAGVHVEERTGWGKDARERVLKHFDVSYIAADYHSLYTELLSR